MLIGLHFCLAAVSVSGFVLRVSWLLTDDDALRAKPTKILPHVIDTLLLLTGVMMALDLAGGFGNSWLIAKLVALIGYIGFGVMAMRAAEPLRWVGVVGALTLVAYMFAVAFSRNPLPLIG